jgi:hypothetical protein
MTVSVSDVRDKATLADYTGELLAKVTRRITDRNSGNSLSEPATVADTPLEVAVPCSATPDAVGGDCSVNTSLDALLPGSVSEGKRAIWQFDRVEVYDGGTDGDTDTADNTLFATQGVFIP